MTKQTQLIRVTATSIRGVDGSRLETDTSRGIAKLPRGKKVIEWIIEFLQERQITGVQIYNRSDGTPEGIMVTSPLMFLNENPKRVLTYNFKQFSVEDFSFYAKDLTKEELSRDVKTLKKVLNV